MAESRKQDDSIESLLTGLLDSRDTVAWKSFLERFGPVMMSAARQHALDPHDVQDCFLHICEKLCEDGCRRLRSFNPSRGGTFSSWLSAIASNLCADWSRARYGRPGIPPVIRSLSALEQVVFDLSVAEGLDRESCLVGVRHRFPEVTRADLADALASVHRALSPKQRWKFTVFRQRGRPAAIEADRLAQVTGKDGDPLDHTTTIDRRARLEAALSQLTPRQRLMLRLRYEQDLTLEEVAQLVGLDDLHQARRMIQVALRELSDLLPEADFL